MFASNKIYLLSLIVLVGPFLGCSSSRQEATFSNGPQKTKYGSRFDVYYGAQTVGWCDYVTSKVEYSDTDADIVETFIEEITFRKLRYKFKFVFIGELTELHVLRYNSDGSLFRANDSFALIKNGDGLSYRFFSDDGEQIIREMPVKDDSNISNAESLFAYCTRYLNSYILFVNDKTSRDLRGNRIQSLGFDLLQFDRL